MTDDRQQQIDDIRSMLDWLEAHADVPMPQPDSNGFVIYTGGVRDVFDQVLKAFGKYEKRWGGTSNDIPIASKNFGSFTLEVIGSKDWFTSKPLEKPMWSIGTDQQ